MKEYRRVGNKGIEFLASDGERLIFKKNNSLVKGLISVFLSQKGKLNGK